MAPMREAPRLALLLARSGLLLLSHAPPGAAFPGANGRIVFVSDRAAPGLNGREIYTSNADGSDPLRLTTNTVADTDPAYSPDGTKIAFTRGNDIWVMNADGSGQVAVTGVEGPDSEPAWSPDGAQIVYVSNQSVTGGGTTGPELFVRNADGSGPVRRLTDTPNNAASLAPAWSPAGNQIAYESNADGSFEIYTIDATATAGFGTRRSANELGQNYQNPSWSPDAARIAFERGTGTNVGDTTKEIWTMRADGTDPVQLTSNSFYDVQPAYSPDGTRIAYESNEGGDREIYTRPASAGGTSTNVTNTSAGATEEQPDWGWGGPGARSAVGPLRLADLDNPTLGVYVNVEPISGTVLVGSGARRRVAGLGRASQKGITFVPLDRGAPDPGGLVPRHAEGEGPPGERREQSGQAPEGRIPRLAVPDPPVERPSAKGLTDLVLKGASFRGCRTRTGGASVALSRRTIRRLRANARGRFRTIGRKSSATVRGTVWDMTDRCDGTLTKVRRGRVVVRDFRRKRNITLTRASRTWRRRPAELVEIRGARSTHC